MPADELNPVVLHQDRSLLVVAKPAGLPAQPDKTGSEDLLTLLSRQLDIPVRSLLPVHRLDRPVAGLMIVARTPAAQTALTRQMAERKMEKSYLAVVCGHLEPPSGEMINHLIKNERLNISRIVPASQPGAKEARLIYQTLGQRTLADGQPVSLIKIQLLTGRHHQIRAQMANAGLPLWGDSKYNPAFRHAGGWQMIALLAAELTFCHPDHGRALHFSLPLPDRHPFALFQDKPGDQC